MPKFLHFILVLFTATQVFASNPPLEVDTIKVVKQTIADDYVYPVRLDANQFNKIYAEVSGVIENLQVQLGDTVQSDTVLFSIKRSDPRFTPLEIKSKITGEVVNINISNGALVNPGDLLMNIVNPESLMLTIEVPVKERKLFHAQSLGVAKFDVAGVTANIKVKNISSNLKKNTGTFTVTLGFTQDVDNLFPGMIGLATFQFNQREANILPQSALYYEKGKSIVRLMVDGKVVKHPVTQGKMLENNMVEITSELSDTDVVIVAKDTYLKQDQAVKARGE